MHSETPWWVTPLLIALSAAVFALDLMLVRGILASVFYLVPVALAVMHRAPAAPLWMAVLCTALSVVGFLFSAEPPVQTVASTFGALNRGFAISTVWAVAVLAWLVVRTRNAIAEGVWLQTRQAELAARVRGEQSLEQLAERSLRFVAEHAGAAVGVLYASQLGTRALKRAAAFAFSDPEGSRADTISWGEGLLGQAAAENRQLSLAEVPPDYMPVRSGLGGTAPRQVIATPLPADEQARGVLELGFMQPPSETSLRFLEQSAETLGIAIRSAQHRERLNELLAQSRQQAQQLQSQQEELRVSNEELETQSRALQESQARLESQHAELEQTNQQIEQQAQSLEARNQELREIQGAMREKAAELERANQYKSQFLANMSHELRTPLNSLLILAKLLAGNKSANLTQEQVEHAETIHSAGTDLLNLINDMLDLTKVEAGKMSLHIDHVAVSDVLGSLEQTFRPLAEEKGLKLRIERQPEAPVKLQTDRQRLEQILKNFLSNALKFTGEGEVVLCALADPQGIAFAVTDTGMGIAAEQQELIFEAFHQADGAINRKFGGTGLGLSVSRGLAQLLGGEISLHSAVEKGSTFTLRLPLASRPQAEVEDEAGRKRSAEQIPAPRPAASATPAASRSAADGQYAASVFSFADDRASLGRQDKSILVVEDDERFAKILYGLAHEMRFKCIVAGTAQEGMTLAKQHQPSAIVLDVRLPDFSGLALLDQLKADPKVRHVPVHVISIEDFSKAALHMGAVGFIRKPAQRDELVKAFGELQERLDQQIKRVLVVEDDPVQRQSLVQLVTGTDVEISAVANALEALDKLEQETYDCMIVDLGLPDLSGYELLERLAETNSPYSYPPVIVYTGRELSSMDEERLKRYSQSIIIKGAKSPERLLSEVALFLHRVESKMPHERQRMLQAVRGREAALEDRKILVVDDDVRNVFALKAILEPHGTIVEVARNGREALDKLDAVPDMDLVLMDIMMPEMDGYEAMARIRTEPRFAELPIIAVTAKAMRDDQEKSLSAGANDYLAKPIDVEKLLSLIRVWLPPTKEYWR